jgi:hypothetical protein
MKRPFWHRMAFYQRQNSPQKQGLLMGVRSICAYAKIGPSTFYKWQETAQFPAMRTPDGRWCTSRDLIDGWIVARWQTQQPQNPTSTSEANHA